MHFVQFFLSDTQAQKLLFCVLWVCGSDNTFRKSVSKCVERKVKFSFKVPFGCNQMLDSRILILTHNVCKLLEVWVGPGVRFNLVQLYQSLVRFLAAPHLGYREDIIPCSTVGPCKMLAG